MISTKLQIRPRSRRLRFSNAEILGLDTAGLVVLVPGPPMGYFFELREVRFLTNIVVAYGNVAAAADRPNMYVFSGFAYISGLVEDTTAGPTSFTDMFVQTNLFGTNMVVQTYQAAEPVNNSCDTVTFAGNAGSLADNIWLFFTNNGADLNGGDPANYMDVFVDYNIVKIAS
jgi:hypothetical protein